MTEYLKTVRAYEGHDPYIFVSYAHKDSDTVLPLIEALQKSGYNVWFDNGIQAGSEWPIYIEQRLTDCSLVLAFVSESAVASRNCRNEINLALKLNKEMFVVHLEETILRYGMELQLGSIQALFKYKQPDDETFVKNLINAEALIPVRQGGKLNTTRKNSDRQAEAENYRSTSLQQQRTNASTSARKEEKKEVPAKKTKRTNIIKYTIIAASFVALVVGSVLMNLLTPQYVGADAGTGVLISVMLIGAVLVLLAIPVAIVKNISLNYTIEERQQVYDDVTTTIVMFGFLAIFIDSFLVNSTDNIFFKILISLGINIARYFITMMFTPDEQKP